MSRSPKRIGIVSVALALAVFCTSLTAAVVPVRSGAMADKEFWQPELDVQRVLTPATAFSDRQGDLADLGVSAGNAYVDQLTGRWATLVPTQPLIPGDGYGNTLTWQQTGLAAPANDDELMARVMDAFSGYLSANSQALRVSLDQLGVANVSINDQLIQIYIPQVIAGVPVRDSSITASLSHGNLILMGTSLWGDVAISTMPAVSADDARWAVVTHLGSLEVTGFRSAPELTLIHANGNDGALGHRLVWSFTPDIAGDMGGWEGLVDAHSGELVAFFDTNKYAAADTRRIVGGVYPYSNDGVDQSGVEQKGWPMPFADFGANTTDEGGNLSSVVTGNLTTNLDGTYIIMDDSCGNIAESNPIHEDLGVSGGDDCKTPAGSDSNGNTHSSRTGFYELNRIAQWARAHNPGNAWLNGKLESNMNINSTCNAFWNGTVNFYRSGGGCGNTGELAGVFDHEWGHGLDDNDNVPSIGFPGEGTADAYTALRLDNSCIGRGFFDSGQCGGYGDPCTDCDGIRDSDWAKRVSGQPHDIGDGLSMCGSCGLFAVVHCWGMIQSESIWDLVNRDLPSEYGMDHNTALEVGTRMMVLGANNVNDWFTCNNNGFDGCGASGGYMNFLTVDDDNGNLNDGTPHMQAIFDAYNRHGAACATPVVQDSGCAGAPTSAPVVTATAGDRSATLSWGAVSGASKYKVYRNEGILGCDRGKIFVGETTGTSFTDDELLNNFDYFYTVAGIGSAGNSCIGPASACDTVVPAADAPSLSISGCPGTATVTGAAPNGPVAFASGTAGSGELGGTGCVGMPIGITGPSLVSTGFADGTGTIDFPVNTCGSSYIAVDYLNCVSSAAEAALQ